MLVALILAVVVAVAALVVAVAERRRRVKLEVVNGHLKDRVRGSHLKRRPCTHQWRPEVVATEAWQKSHLLPQEEVVTPEPETTPEEELADWERELLGLA